VLDLNGAPRTGVAEGRMVFIGVGGAIDGQVDPTDRGPRADCSGHVGPVGGGDGRPEPLALPVMLSDGYGP